MEILTGNLYGVDLDAQAVEIARLNLLLKAVNQRGLLPPLDNVRQGNSLISGTPAELEAAFGPGWRDKHPFNWEEEFPRIMERGGFDVIVGNPPYGIVFDMTMKQYLEERFETFRRNNDTFVAFVQRALQLLRPGGLFGFIIPNTFLTGPYFDGLKHHILDIAKVERVVDFSTCQVFADPNVFTAILILKKKDAQEDLPCNSVSFVEVQNLEAFPETTLSQQIPQSQLLTLQWVVPSGFFAKLLQVEPKLGDIAFVKDVGLNYWTKGRGKQRGGSIAKKSRYLR
jgi:type I restriction-modification system DNA methylase subunit